MLITNLQIKKIKNVDIFNDGLNNSDSESEEDIENLDITYDDLRLEFEKSVNIKNTINTNDIHNNLNYQSSLKLNNK